MTRDPRTPRTAGSYRETPGRARTRTTSTRCEGSKNRNGFYGWGITDALDAVTK
ncbi:hypothetical protein ABZ499_35355 [Streptomyces sp. NPDC019990]|uniref:hypothetical protein n=1 Tax=Streptomyces sp. NPDC019990 TaxID=3154693 RepID=UPI0033F72A67